MFFYWLPLLEIEIHCKSISSAIIRVRVECSAPLKHYKALATITGFLRWYAYKCFGVLGATLSHHLAVEILNFTEMYLIPT
jgi:hypothetical protein